MLGINPNLDPENKTPYGALCRALQEQFPGRAFTRRLTEQHPSAINSARKGLDGQPMTPIMEACLFFSEDTAQLHFWLWQMVRAGASPDVPAPLVSPPVTVFAQVVRSGNKALAREMLRLGANPELACYPGGQCASSFSDEA